MSEQRQAAVLEVSGITKRYLDGDRVVEAVKGVNLTLNRGEFVAVMGASGSGKSTLLHVIAGLTRPDEGAVRIIGQDIDALSDHALTLFRRQHIGLVFQAFNLLPALTAEENIGLPILLGNDPSDDNVRRLVEELGLQDVRGRRPDTMSGGEQQRVAIGRALVSNPSLILADEPTGSLDSVNGRKLCGIFKRLCRERGATVLMVTHNPIVAFEAERIIILKDGGIVSGFSRAQYGTVQALTQHYYELVDARPEEATA